MSTLTRCCAAAATFSMLLAATGASQTARAQARPTLTIVGVGDSYSSGQGSPDVRARPPRPGQPGRDPQWLASGMQESNPRVTSSNKDCARSNLSWQRLVAERMVGELDADVRYISFACSGATIPDLIEREQPDVQFGPQPPLPPGSEICQGVSGQLCDVERHFGAANGRTIDALLVTIGGNDVGFAPAVKTCIVTANCQTARLVLTNAMTDLERGKDLLRERFRKLAAAIELMNRRSLAAHGRLLIANVFLVEYPSGFRDERGRLCPRSPSSDLDPFPDPLDSVSAEETAWGESVVLPALNEMAKDGAQRIRLEAMTRADPQLTDRPEGRYGFFIAGTGSRFARHGFCAKNSERWVVRVKESLEQQLDASGAVHPAPPGHLAIADIVAPELRRLRPPGAIALTIGPSPAWPQGGTAVLASGLRLVPAEAPAGTEFIQVARRTATGRDGLDGMETPANGNLAALVTPPRIPAILPANDWRMESHTGFESLRLSGVEPAQDLAIRACTAAACSAWSKPLRAVFIDGFERLPNVTGLTARISSRSTDSVVISSRWNVPPARPNGHHELRFRGRTSSTHTVWRTDGPSHSLPVDNYLVAVRRCVAGLVLEGRSQNTRCGDWSAEVPVNGLLERSAESELQHLKAPSRDRPSAIPGVRP
jgi:lysophospholipase L1-like esterase